VRKFLFVSFSALTVLFGAQRSAEASAITFTGSPVGMTFSIESVVATTDLFTESPTPLNDTYLVTLQLITTTAYADATRYLQSVALDVGGGVDGALLDSASPGTLTWGFDVDSTIHSNGKCVGAPALGSVCVEEDPGPPNVLLQNNATYTWVFKIDLNDTTGTNVVPSLVFATATVKENGEPQWEETVVSASLTGSGPVIDLQDLDPPGAEAPEPASMVLLGTGLAGLVAYRHRTRRR